VPNRLSAFGQFRKKDLSHGFSAQEIDKKSAFKLEKPSAVWNADVPGGCFVKHIRVEGKVGNNDGTKIPLEKHTPPHRICG
jgi:hypothetical protein